jgi:hypothetical protein
MLIARIKSVMHVRYTSGRQLCYKDHIVNLPQDITEVAQRLPRLPQDLDMFIIRRHDENLDRHVGPNVQVSVSLFSHDATYTSIEPDGNNPC